MIRTALSFDDVLIVPKYSEVKSRADVNLTVELSKGLVYHHPIVPANMKSVSGPEMCKFIASTGGLALLHRFMSYEQQLDILKSLPKKHLGLSIGIKEEDKTNFKSFIAHGLLVVCVDVAHGDMERTHSMVNWISETYPQVFIVAGNVSTSGAALRLWEAGADMVKSSIGGGSLCTTRIVSGCGVPTFQACMDIANFKYKGKYLMADGGIRNSGDCVKALCFADMTMLGSAFAGTDETPGDPQHKEYDGSSTHKSSRVEGIRSKVEYKGSADTVLKGLLEGIQSGCSYQGAHNLASLRQDPEFIRITPAGLRESHPHINR